MKVRVADKTYELREYAFHGKYEGGLEIARMLDDAELFSESVGDVETTGHYGRIDGPLTDTGSWDITADERAYLSTVAGAIVHTDSQGFVRVTFYWSHSEVDRMWEQVTQEIEDAEATSHLEAFSEAPERRYAPMENGE